MVARAILDDNRRQGESRSLPMSCRAISIVFLFALTLSVAISIMANDPAAGLAKMNWLVGEWQRTDLPTGESGYERWQPKSPSGFAGIGVHERGNGNRFEETLSIEIRDGAIHYIAKTPQNSVPVAFRLVELRDDGFAFENRTHDFPKRIDYRRDGEHGLVVRISDDVKVVDFDFEKRR
jgi:hypothetical protein